MIKKDAVINPAVAKKDAVNAATEAGSSSTGSSKEEGEIVEKSIIGILRGRNPVMFCNDQSKLRGLHMEWEQVRMCQAHESTEGPSSTPSCRVRVTTH